MMGVMVVDDEEGVRRSLKKVLEADGYSITLAESGREAIEIIRHNGRQIEVVISDFKMPGIDGLETLVEIGKINPEITRIMLTGYATMESAIEAVNAGIDGFLTKPFDNKELRAKVREFMMKKHLKQLVSEQVLQEMQQDSRRLAPRDVEAAVMFIDIRGFSNLAESLRADELCELINTCYFAPLDDIIFQYNGTLDKHIGDAIMAVFGAPKGYGDDALRAVHSALALREKMQEVNERLAANGLSLPIGIGIATGMVRAGMFGSRRKKEYTVYGNTVVLAARLEKLAQGGQIIICGETYRRTAGEIEVEAVGDVALKGVGRLQELYSVTALKEKKS